MAVLIFPLVLVIVPVPGMYLCHYSSSSGTYRSSIAVPGVYPLSTVKLGKGIGLRLNLL